MYKWIVAAVLYLVACVTVLPMLISSNDWMVFSLGIVWIVGIYPLGYFIGSRLRKKRTGTIVINGVRYEGNDLTIEYGKLIIDGKVVNK